MKKRLIITAALLLLLTACGKTDEVTNNSSSAANSIVDIFKGGSDVLPKLDVENYVTIGEYKGLSADVTVGEVEDIVLEGSLRYYYKLHVTEEYGVREGVVKDGDTVNIAFVGKLDGVAFDGGTSESYDLTIGSKNFIDGFESGLIGVAVGDTVDLNLTFPENYGSADLAGKAVVFTVTVHYLFPEENDEVAKLTAASMGISDVNTYDDLREAFRKIINDGYKDDAATQAKDIIMEKFFDDCLYTQGTPDFLIKLNNNTIEEMMYQAAAANGTDVDTICNYYYGKDLETLKADTTEKQSQEILALQAVANLEGLNVSDEELDSLLASDAAANGFASVDEMIGNINKEYYRNFYMSERVENFIVENAVINYN